MVHVTNFVQSRNFRLQTDSFTFLRVVSSIFPGFCRLASDLEWFFLEKLIRKIIKIKLLFIKWFTMIFFGKVNL